MKVTSNIREYIKEEVTKILAGKVNPYSEQAKADRQMIEDFCKELRDSQREIVEQFIEANELVDTWCGKNTKFHVNISSPSFGHAATPAMINAKQWEDEHEKYKASKTREIIAKLELGANRQELEAMFAELAANL